jgi:hypothetical protein
MRPNGEAVDGIAAFTEMGAKNITNIANTKKDEKNFCKRFIFYSPFKKILKMLMCKNIILYRKITVNMNYVTIIYRINGNPEEVIHLQSLKQ